MSKENTKIILSIIVPVYKVRDYIVKCLESIEHQNIDKTLYEVLVVNDGTPDDSMNVADPIIKRIGNARVINQENQGLSGARNTGLDVAQGEYVWFVDSDDWLLTNSINMVLSVIHSNKGVDVVSSALLQMFEATGKEETDFTPTHFFLNGKEYLKLHYCQGAVQRFIIRRQFLAEHNLTFYPQLLHEDGFFGLQMLYFANSVVVLSEPVYAYRIRQSGSIMSSITMKTPHDLLFIHKELRKFEQNEVAKEDRKWYRHRIAYVINDLYQFSKPIITSSAFHSFYHDNWTYLHREVLILLTKPLSFIVGLRLLCFPVLWVKFKYYMRAHILPPPVQIRRLSFRGRRVLNYMSKLSNNITFAFYGIEHGKNFCVHGHVGLRIKKGARMIVGNDFYYSSGRHVNPLSCNKQGNITVNEGAKVIIGDHVGMSGTVIWCHESITVGNHVQIGAGSVLLDSDCHSLNHQERRTLQNDMLHKKNAPIMIEDDVLIGMNCLILKGVTIGARSVIGAGSVVTQSIPADTIAAGNPAKVIKHIG